MSNNNVVISSIEELIARANEIHNNSAMFSSETFITRLLKNVMFDSYSTTLFKLTASHKVAIKPLTNKQVVIYDEELLKKLCDARKIIIHKIASFTSQRRETYFIVMLFEKYEKFLAGVWLVTNKVDPMSYQTFFKYIKMDFPYFKPEDAVVDYDEDMQHGLRSVFPEINFIPSFLHQMQEIIENAMQTNAAIKANRILNAEKHSMLKKFIALSLLPKENIHACHINLVKECKANYGSYFDLFINYYHKEWMVKWRPEVFCVHQLKDLTKVFMELYACRKVFGTKTELEPAIFLDKIKATLSQVRMNLVSLEHGDILPYYLSHEDEIMECKLHRTWNRRSNDLITIKECLTICSNLLNNSFIDSLTDLTAINKMNNNNTHTEKPNVSIHDLTTEKVR